MCVCLQIEKLYDIVAVGPLGPGVHYLPVYWACGPSQGQRPTRGGEAFVSGDCVENRKVGFGHNSSRECAEVENVLGQTKLRS